MDVRYIKGVGEKRAELLAKLGIFTVGDMLSYYPRDYVDYSKPYPVQSAPFDVKCVVKAVVHGKNSVRISGGRQVHKAICADETAQLTINFFNNPYALDKLKQGEEYLFYGKVGGNFAARDMINPSVISEQSAKDVPLVAIYPQTEGINSAYITKCVRACFDINKVEDDPLPTYLIEKYKLLSRQDALKYIHFPADFKQVEAARRRLVFEELLILQVGLFLLRKRENLLTAVQIDNVDLTKFWQSLPFEPTGAQKRSTQQIISDMAKPSPMNRLLQGDVGSGKTLVAAAAMVAAAQNGYQSVLMAPTEILASQHAKTLQKMLSGFKIEVALLTKSVKSKERKEVLAQINDGTAQIVVGTHSVLNDEITFKNLGLAITDEQHRFGVRQRAKLAAKANNPHLLVMSATPIPRTLALLMFGDLDISELDEMPPNRKRVKTYAITDEKRADMYGFIKKHLDSGNQAYIICPLIEEGVTDMQAVSVYYEEVASKLLCGYKVGLMHGKLKAADKAQVMDEFAGGELDVLVSTTVIEVGVDVPNANIIAIENAERYGLSALHQLRGRVGRGADEAYCILISNHTGENVRERLSVLCGTNDGFEIARYDLETRGPGDFFGSRQHGLPTLRIADLAADARALNVAQKEAHDMLEADPELRSDENIKLRTMALKLFGKQTAMN